MWDAINHAMTGLATGGFSITDNSIGTYDSMVIDFALIPVMVLGSIAFPIHFLILRGEIRNFYADLQTRWVFGFFGIGTGVLTIALALSGTYQTLFETFRYALFQFVSAASCTGFQTAGSLGNQWSPGAKLVVALGMFVGAAAGSTVGGIKLIRALTLVKGTLFRVGGVFYPNSAVRPFRIDDRTLSDVEASREFEEATIISFLWMVFLSLGLGVLLITMPIGPSASYGLADAVFEIASTQGNVGLSAGLTGPGMPWQAKTMLVFNMWIGRLEIIPVLVLLRGMFTKREMYR